MVDLSGGWAELGKRWGPWVLLCAFLVYFVTSSVAAKQDTAIGYLLDLKGAMAKHIADEDEHHKEERFFLRGTCLNTAKTDLDRARCLP